MKLTEPQRREVFKITSDFPDKLKNLVKHLQNMIKDRVVGDLIKKTLAPKGLADEDVRELIRIGVPETTAFKGELAKIVKETGLPEKTVKKALLIEKAIFKKATDALKPEDIEALTRETLGIPEFQENVLRFKSIHFQRELGEEKPEAIERLREKYKELGPVEIAKTNQAFLRATVTSPAFRALYPPLEIKGKRITLDDIEKFREAAAKEILETEEEIDAAAEALEVAAKKPPKKKIPETGAGI